MEARPGRYLGSMDITMLLCDSALVAEGKLFILGGGWSVTGPDPAPSALALKMAIPYNNDARFFHWEIFLEDADGKPVILNSAEGLRPVEVMGDIELAENPEGANGIPVDVCLAVNVPPLPLDPDTRFVWRLTVNGEPQPGGTLAFATRPAVEV